MTSLASQHRCARCALLAAALLIAATPAARSAAQATDPTGSAATTGAAAEPQAGTPTRSADALPPAGAVDPLPVPSSTGPARAAPQLGSPLRSAGGTQWSVFYGFGINQEINNSAEGIHIATGGVRWSHMWSEKLGGMLRGHPTVAVELLPVMAFVEKGGTAWGAGANLLYEHHFALPGRILPVWKIGAGLLYTDHEVPVRETKHNFSLLTALGVDLMVTETSALFLGYRFHHVSNANTGKLNPGINVHSMVFGLSFYR